MINFTKRYINTVSFIISLIIMLFLNNQNFVNQTVNSEEVLSKETISQVNSNLQNSNQENSNNQNSAQENKKEEQSVENIKTEEINYDWQIEIPAINLKAEISEGTSKETMDKYVGHFEETVKTGGNVGLAAHNRGYSVNYFQDLKKLKEGDEIIYKYNDFKKIYIVKENLIINDDDWSYLEETKDNRITLITCVENEPQYGRCIQAIEKEVIEKLEEF